MRCRRVQRALEPGRQASGAEGCNARKWLRYYHLMSKIVALAIRVASLLLALLILPPVAGSQGVAAGADPGAQVDEIFAQCGT